jgi:hypothetical protein
MKSAIAYIRLNHCITIALFLAEEVGEILQRAPHPFGHDEIGMR